MQLPFSAFKQAHRQKIALPTFEGIQFEQIDHIVSIEAQSNYANITFLGGRQLLVCKTLREIERMINNSLQFVRIHRSFTINLEMLAKYIKGKGGYVIMCDQQSISVSNGRKAAFMEAVGHYFKCQHRADQSIDASMNGFLDG